jgi:hypothetical protein
LRTDLPDGRRLDSWKEIAAYLGRHERTVIRWEKKKRLPVHRIRGGERSAVFAFTAELDTWLRREEAGEPVAVPQGPKPRSDAEAHGTAEVVPFPSAFFPSGQLKRIYYVVLAAAVVVIAVIIAFASRTHAGGQGFPVRVGFTLNALQAFDAAGEMLWSYPLPGTLDPNDLIDGRRFEDDVRIADFRGDGEHEVLAVLRTRVSPNATSTDHFEVDMFSDAGKLLWSYIPRGHLLFDTHDLKDSWKPLDVFVSGSRRKQIWVAADHAIWGHSFIVSLDPETGKDTLRYVNSGTTVSLNEMATPHGNFLLAGGFNNEYDSGSLAVLDESKGFAASPQTEGTNHKCLNCPKGDPDYYFVFPRSELNELMQFYQDRVSTIRVMGDEIELRKNETERPVWAQSFYLLKSDSVIHPISVRFETNYDLLHQKLQREGKIGHSLANCPERLHPRPVRMWTPAGGWTEIQLEASRSDE